MVGDRARRQVVPFAQLARGTAGLEVGQQHRPRGAEDAVVAAALRRAVLGRRVRAGQRRIDELRLAVGGHGRGVDDHEQPVVEHGRREDQTRAAADLSPEPRRGERAVVPEQLRVEIAQHGGQALPGEDAGPVCDVRLQACAQMAPPWCDDGRPHGFEFGGHPFGERGLAAQQDLAQRRRAAASGLTPGQVAAGHRVELEPHAGAGRAGHGVQFALDGRFRRAGFRRDEVRNVSPVPREEQSEKPEPLAAYGPQHQVPPAAARGGSAVPQQQQRAHRRRQRRDDEPGVCQGPVIHFYVQHVSHAPLLVRDSRGTG